MLDDERSPVVKTASRQDWLHASRRFVRFQEVNVFSHMQHQANAANAIYVDANVC